MRAKAKKLLPVHPGKALKEVLDDAGITANALALALRIPANRLTEIINRRRSISADTALRLALYFGEAAEDALASKIKTEVQPWKKAS